MGKTINAGTTMVLVVMVLAGAHLACAEKQTERSMGKEEILYVLNKENLEPDFVSMFLSMVKDRNVMIGKYSVGQLLDLDLFLGKKHCANEEIDRRFMLCQEMHMSNNNNEFKNNNLANYCHDRTMRLLERCRKF